MSYPFGQKVYILNWTILIHLLFNIIIQHVYTNTNFFFIKNIEFTNILFTVYYFFY